jgi:hypothetical protein
MHQVWKFPLMPEENEVELPVGAEVLTVELTSQGPALLALVDPDAERETRTFLVIGNGTDLPEGVAALHYRGTAKVPGAFTAHVFETTSVEATA